MSVINLSKTTGVQEPMFFGNGLGLQRFDKYKYPVFKQLASRMEGYFWRPEEVPLDRDNSDYKLLSPAEQRIFLLNLSYQILLDSVQGRAIIPAFGAVASLPELEPCFNWWQAFETLHSRSYSYIIENLYPNPSKIFDQVLEIEPLIARSNSLTDSYDKMIELSCKYTLDPGQFNNKFGNNLLRRSLLDSLVAVYILESIRFYVSFACTFALGELKRMEGNAKIIQLIQRDEQIHQSLTLHIINILTEKEGYEPYFDRERAAGMFKEAAEEEKAWARFLFQEGSMIGLNDKILGQYIEVLTNQRAAAIGIRKIYPDAPTKTPLPWMTNWTSSRSTQVAPQETQITSYMVSSVKQEKVDLGDFSL